MIINKFLSAVFINTLVIYIISKYMPFLWFTIDFKVCSFEIYLFIWFVFWFLDTIVKAVVKILTLPLNILTLWLFSIVINVLFIYLFQYVINNYMFDIAIVHLWTWVNVLITSVLIRVFNLLFKKL